MVLSYFLRLITRGEENPANDDVEPVSATPVTELKGIGKATAEKLSSQGIIYIEQLQEWRLKDLIGVFDGIFSESQLKNYKSKADDYGK